METLLALTSLLVLTAVPRGQDEAVADAAVAFDESDLVLSEARAALDRATAAREAGDSETARTGCDLVMELLAPLSLDAGQEECADILWDLGFAACAVGNLTVAREAWSRVLAFREQFYPKDDVDLLWAQGNLATVFQETGDLRRARELEEAVLKSRERTLPPDDPDLITARLNLASTLSKLGDKEGARSLNASALASCERSLPEDHPALLAARVNYALSLRKLGEYESARRQLEAALAGYERTVPNTHPNLLATRLNLAFTLKKTGDLAGARRLDEAVLAGYELLYPPEHRALITARLNLADTMSSMGDFRGSMALYESVVETLENTIPENHSDLPETCSKLARVMLRAEDPAGARVFFERALAGYERIYPEEHPVLFTARLDLAGAMKEMGDVSDARVLLEAMLEGNGQSSWKEHPDWPRARATLGGALMQMGELAEACPLLESALEGFEQMRPDGDPDLIKIRLNLAGAVKQMGDLARARALEETVLDARERALPEHHPELSAARLNLSVTLAMTGDLEGARSLAEAALAGYERTFHEDHPDLFKARLNVAGMRMQMGDFEGARALEEAVVARMERTYPSDHLDLIAARSNLALTMSMMGDSAGARALLETALVMRERIHTEDHPALLTARQNLATTLAETGDREGARALGVDLARGMLRRLELAAALSSREARAAAGAEAHRHSVVRLLTEAREEGSTELIRFDLAETLRATSSASSLALDESDPRRRELMVLRTRLNDIVSAGEVEGLAEGSLAAEVSRLSFERDRLEREIREELAGKGIVTGALQAERVAEALSRDSAAVGFLRYEKWVLDDQTSKITSGGEVLAAHVLLRDGSLVELELGEAAELEELALSWRSSLGRPVQTRGVAVAEPADSSELATKAGIRLREILIDPVFAAAGRAKRLHICLDDFLHALPIEALPLDDGVVRDRYVIVNETSFARLLNERSRSDGELGLLVVGDVAFDAEKPVTAVADASAAGGDPSRSDRAGDFLPLAETRVEARTTGVLFEDAFGREPSLLLKENATKAAFHELVPGKQFVHIATHGWFAPETVKSILDHAHNSDRLWSSSGTQETVTGLAPMTLCGLAFAGANNGRDSLGRVPGIMTAEELAGIDLSACELAVLSACETNVGIRRAGQGIQSLQAALHAAGARTSITSLWKVDDAATRKLFERFYTYLWVEEMGKADALWKAKCDLRAEGHPVRDWAAWMLTGDPD